MTQRRRRARDGRRPEIKPGDPLLIREDIKHLICCCFDRLLLDALNRGRPNHRAVPASVYHDFIEFMESLPQSYIEEVESGYIVATQVSSATEFLNAISIERIWCYLALSPLRVDIDATLPMSNPEWALKDLAAELRVSNLKMLQEVLWQGKWRNSRYWGNEFTSLRNEIRNYCRRRRRTAQKEREAVSNATYLDPLHAELQEIGESNFSQVNKALFEMCQSAMRSESFPLRLGEGRDDWAEIGKEAQLGGREREVLASRAKGEISRQGNERTYKAIQRAFPKLAEVIEPRLESPKADGSVFLERIRGEHKIFQFLGLGLC